MRQPSSITEQQLRFERFPTTDLQLPGMPPRCSCWTVTGPYARHPGGCTCRCHGGRDHEEVL